VNLAPFVSAVLERPTGADSRLHGIDHWRRVARIGSELAAKTPGADKDVVEAFAYLHDAMRRNDSDDPGHGGRGAMLASSLRASGTLDMEDDPFLKLVEACRDHTSGKTSSDPTIGVCWDADRLELTRCGIQPVASLLSTAAARERIGERRAITKTSAVGWRVWRYKIQGSTIRLIAPEVRLEWNPGRYRASCVFTTPGSGFYSAAIPEHDVPSPDCSCGVWVSDSIAAARASFIHGQGWGWGSPLVAGRVRLHGRIIPDRIEGAWRGEAATILSLYVRGGLGSSGIADMLSREYGVPVAAVRDLDSLGSGVPLDVAADVRNALGWGATRAHAWDSRPRIEDEALSTAFGRQRRV
jgi:uncharacterized protein